MERIKLSIAYWLIKSVKVYSFCFAAYKNDALEMVKEFRKFFK